ncbi:hypothetical protein OWV82_003009 [Melia azedarach]|uniref:Uncharacterized protein n=1 Tax=Melia azedarach TaxID=155640 RepID=A0ACC1Z487_MELAZ|nr:hypothetical protein OWV82_003009 [Melia azedarach]
MILKKLKKVLSLGDAFFCQRKKGFRKKRKCNVLEGKNEDFQSQEMSEGKCLSSFVAVRKEFCEDEGSGPFLWGNSMSGKICSRTCRSFNQQ